MNFDDKQRVSDNNESLSLAQMARLLNVSEKAIFRMAECVAIPAAKAGDEWRFQRAALDNLLFKTMESADSESLVGVVRSRRDKINPLPQLAGESRILLNIEPADKTTLLGKLAGLMTASGTVEKGDDFLRSVLEREKICSTAFGKGFAVPHELEHNNTGVRQPAMVIGVCPKGVDFESLDGALTYVFLMICAPTTAAYLRLLAKTLVMMRMPGILDDFRKAESRDAVMKILYKANVDFSIRF